MIGWCREREIRLKPHSWSVFTTYTLLNAFPNDFDVLRIVYIVFKMFSRQAARVLSRNARLFSSSAARQTRVAVLGASGGIGQPLSLLLKLDPLVSSLSLYDIRLAPGVAADVSHVDTPGEVIILLKIVIQCYTVFLMGFLPISRSRATPLTSLMRHWMASRLSLFLLVFRAR